MKTVVVVLVVLAAVALIGAQSWLSARGRKIRDQRAAEDEAYDRETGRDQRHPE